MTRETSNEVRAKCRRRWVAERQLWRIWRRRNHDRQGHYERAQLAHELRCEESARKRMREAAAARMSTTAREITAGKVVRSGAWLGELGAALHIAECNRMNAEDGSQLRKDWATMQRVLSMALDSERRHSPNDGDSR